jgi:16S rRNA U1498 N3-methylase RsmE
MIDKATISFSSPLVKTASSSASEASKPVVGEAEKKQIWINLGDQQNLFRSDRPFIDLILAVPRPQRLLKMFSVISCLGIRRLFLVNASKVEKDYFGMTKSSACSDDTFNLIFFVISFFSFVSGCHVLMPEKKKDLNELLIEGLSQAAVDYHLPEIIVCRHFNETVYNKKVVHSDDSISSILKIILHPKKLLADPPSMDTVTSSASLSSSSYLIPKLRGFLSSVKSREKEHLRIQLAIGPDGGWEDKDIQLYEHLGFHCVGLGHRILRTDIAVGADLTRDFSSSSFICFRSMLRWGRLIK